MASATDVLSLLLTVRTMCETAGAAKDLLRVVVRKIDSLVPIVSKIQSCGEAALVSDTHVQRVLAELKPELEQTQKIAAKASKMNRFVFIARAPGLREKLEDNLKAIHLSLMTLQATQSEQLASELRHFHREWRKRQDELREEARREERERRRLREDPRALLQETQGQSEELEDALKELAAAREELLQAAELEAAGESVARDKARAEARFMDQIIASLQQHEAAINALPRCPITFEIMTDPVIVDAVCMHTVSREGFNQWVERGNTVCPLCRSELRSKIAVPNAPLRDVIEQMARVELQNSPVDQTAAAQPPPQPSAPPAPVPAPLPSPAGAATAPTPLRNQRAKRFRDGGFWGYGGVWGDYTGELDSSGQRHGRGVIKWEDGDVYEGEWKNGKMEGRGTFRYASGSVYEGEWKDDKKEGRGTYRWADGDVYEGEWKNDTMEGRGTYRRADGSVYEGEWKNDKKEGRGTFRYASGDVYEGEWKNGKAEGRGTYRWAHGRVQVTRNSGGEPVGEGVCWSADRQTAYRLKDGKKGRSISLRKAKGIADRIGVPIPT